MISARINDIEVEVLPEDEEAVTIDPVDEPAGSAAASSGANRRENKEAGARPLTFHR